MRVSSKADIEGKIMSKSDKELIALRLWKEDAQEALAEYRADEENKIALIAEMHTVIGLVSDSLHQSQLALNKYVEAKTDYFSKNKK